MRFINGENKTINVSVELINYTPVSIDFLVDRMDKIIYGEAVDEEPVFR
jgi:calcineurin-like phosphoesterase family protein